VFQLPQLRRASAALFTAAACATGAGAQETPSSRLEAVTVTGSRAPRALSELPTSVSQVEAEELQQQLRFTTNILQALDVLVPGLAISTDFRNSTCTSIRGRSVQLLINGVPTNDNLRTSNCRGLASISPYAIERIEVVRGGTALYGLGAPGGVINLITRRAKSDRLEIDAVAQVGVNPAHSSDTREFNAYVGAGQAFAGWDYYAGVSYQDFGTRRNPDGGLVPGQEDKSVTFDASIGARLGGGELRFTGSYFRQNPGTVYEPSETQVIGTLADPIVVTPPNPFESQARGEVVVAALSYEHPMVLGHRLLTSLYLHDESNIQRDAFVFEGEPFYSDSDQDNQRYGLRSSLTRAIKLGKGELETTYGLDLLRQRFYRPLVDPAAGGAVIGYVSPEVTLDSAALFVQPQYRLGPWLFSGGVRHERFKGKVGREGFDSALPRAGTPGDIADFDVTLFNAGVVYDLEPKVQLYAGFSQGAEIAELGRAARGIEDPSLIRLDGANSNQVEVGIRGRRGSLDFSAAAFYSKSDEAADLAEDPSCADQPFCPLIPVRLKQKVYGIEGSADWSVNAALKLGGILTWQKGEFQEPDQPAIPLDAGSATPLRISAYAQWTPLPRWRTRLQGTYTAASDVYGPEQEAEGFRDSQSLFLMDFSAGVKVEPGELSLGIANLLNKRYVNVANSVRGDFFYYLAEGRRVSLSYSARF